MANLSLLALTRYSPTGASSRYRTFQYLPYLQEQGVKVNVQSLLGDEYLQAIYSGRRAGIRDVAPAYLSRVASLLRRGHADVVLVEKELFPMVPAVAELLLLRRSGPFVLDLDDAIFHHYDWRSGLVGLLVGNKIEQLMAASALVTAGNEYLARRAAGAGAARVEILPSVVDLERYPRTSAPPNDRFTIGWIGTPITARYLEQIRPALAAVCAGARARLRVVGAGPEFALEGVPTEVVPWSQASEARELRGFDVGIMPLSDSPWERGKCGLKLIQYMACEKPTVASPVGENTRLITHGVNGFLARTEDEWTGALRTLADDPGLCRAMGAAGRSLVERRYCLRVTAPRLFDLLVSAANSSRGKVVSLPSCGGDELLG